jgi:integrase
MPRKIELTWQAGTRGRKGRWRKKYKGRVLYFAHGTSKSDLAGYRRAVEEWKQKKVQIDAEESLRPKPHQEEYEQALQEWALVLTWSRENADDKHARAALKKLEELKARLAMANPPPLGWGDHVLDLGFPPEFLQAMSRVMNEGLPGTRPPGDLTAPGVFVPSQQISDSLDGSPARIAREIWRDRLNTQRRRSQNTPNTVESCVASFLESKRAQVEGHELTAGRYDVLRVHLHHFSGWIGPTLAISCITGKAIAEYHRELLNGMSDRRWSADYARTRMSVVKSFIRWLWRIEAIEQPPRILDSKMLNIGTKATTPEVFTVAEVTALLTAATDRTRLYLLLMLNTGMLQKDISDLRPADVDWRKGTITRRRTKTTKYENVPTVTYRLWKETHRLLRQERATDGEFVLTNEGGGPLKVERLDENGKLRKIDNVKSAFHRLSLVTKIKKPLKLFRKTSATLLRGNKQFSGIEHVFLGHAPRTMADRHYAQVPQELLDEAIVWLGTQFGIE